MDYLDGLDNCYVVIEFQDQSVDVVRESDLVFDGPLICHSSVKVMYRTTKSKKIQEFVGKVLYFNASRQSAEEFLEKAISEESRPTASAYLLGRGKRIKINKRRIGEEEEENADHDVTPNLQISKKKKKTEKDLKRSALIESAKFIAENQTSKSKGEFQSKEILPHELKIIELEKENERLRLENRKLKKERDDAIEIKSLLKTTKAIAKRLETWDRDHQPEQERPRLAPEVAAEVIDHGLQLEQQLFENVQLAPDPTPVVQEQHNNNVEEGNAERDRTIYRYPTLDETTTELAEGSKIYVLKSALEDASNSKTHSQIARALLMAVFTINALISKTIRGKRANEGLPSQAINAIISVSNRLAEKAKVKVESEKDIVKNLGTKLSELRATQKRREKQEE